MMHQHNASTLLGGKRRSVYYPPDGSGRDSYIRTDNGGTNIVYRCQGVAELGNHVKVGSLPKTFRPASYTRFQKYTSDGSGRDKYVMYIMDISIDHIMEDNIARMNQTMDYW